MTDFSATDAAFEGFRITRERPKAVLIWAGLILLAALLSQVLLIGIAGEAFGDFMAMGQRRGQPDPDELGAMMGRLAPAFLLLLPLGLIYYAVLYSAVYRAILRPEEGGAGFLKLGGDEFRVLGALALLVLILMGGTFAAGLILSVLGGLAGRGAAVLGVLLLLGGMVFLVVRLSLALPATFAERRILIFESWRLTKGRFWALLGAYVLAGVLAIVVSMLGLMIYVAVGALLAGGLREAVAVFRPDLSSITAWLTPAMIIYLLVNSLLTAITNALMLAPSAVAYRELSGARAPA